MIGIKTVLIKPMIGLLTIKDYKVDQYGSS